jgi:hypothetical protein
LQDLNGRGQIVRLQDVQRDARLILLIGRLAQRVKQDVGINEPHRGRESRRGSGDPRR